MFGNSEEGDLFVDCLLHPRTLVVLVMVEEEEDEVVVGWWIEGQVRRWFRGNYQQLEMYGVD